MLGIGLKQEIEHYKLIAMEQENRLRMALKKQKTEHMNRLIGCKVEDSGDGSLESVKEILMQTLQAKAV